MNYNDIIKLVSIEVGLPEDVVNNIYKAYWLSVKDKILELPLKENLTDLEFSNLRVNFNIPSLGKLCCTLDRFINMKKRFEYIKQLRKQNV